MKREEDHKRGAAPAPNPLETAAAEGLATVVIVGRANAGKSTLFNRIVRRGRAIVSSIAGTTRDLNIARATYEEREFVIADSGGLELYASESVTEHAVEEAFRAVAAADVVVFLIDGHAGISGADEEALELIRATGKPLIMAVNKVDNPGRESAATEAYRLGVEDVVFISAAHGLGVTDLLDTIVAKLPARDANPERVADLRVALIGRPNAGKSSILNRLAGFDRSIVDEHPGTTRDPVDVRLRAGDREVLLIDTAGMRRPTRVEGELEHHSVGRAIETIRRAEVLILVIDATEGITDQDVRVARLVESNDRAMIIVCNKWDAASAAGKRVPAFVSNTYRRHPFLDFAPLIFTSALTGDGIGEIIPAAARAGKGWHSAFQTARVESDFGRYYRGDGSAADRTASAQVDVRDADRQCTATADLLRQRRARYSCALHPLSRKPVSHRTQARWRRYAVALRVQAHWPFMDGRAPSTNRTYDGQAAAQDYPCAAGRQAAQATSC